MRECRLSNNADKVRKISALDRVGGMKIKGIPGEKDRGDSNWLFVSLTHLQVLGVRLGVSTEGQI